MLKDRNIKKNNIKLVSKNSIVLENKDATDHNVKVFYIACLYQNKQSFYYGIPESTFMDRR